MSARAARIPVLVFALVFASVLLVRLAYLAELSRSALSEWYRWRETDEFTFVDWSRHLAAGNWRDVPAYRASFVWMAASGTPEEWEKRYVPNAYFQGPLYAYVLALVRVTVDHVVSSARLLQALLAALTAAFVAAAVRRLLERRTGPRAALAGALVAGLAYGVYAPSLFHDGFLYRDGPLSHASTLLLAIPLLLGSFGAAGLFGLGLGAGLLTLLKQTALPVGLAAVALAVAHRRGPRGRALAAALGGLALPLALLAARNLSAGVPPFVFDTRQAFTFVWAHGRGAAPMSVPPPETFRILDRTGPSTVKAALAVWGSWRGDRAGLFRLEANKALSFFQAFEPSDNASFDFYRARLPLLRAAPGFVFVLGPGLVGLAAAAGRKLLTRGEAALLAVGLLVPLASTVLALSLSRYRLPAIGPLAMGAGLGVGLLLGAPWKRAAAALAAAALVSAVALTPPAIPTPRHRWVDTMVLAAILEVRGEHAQAVAEGRRYLAEGGDDIDRARGVTQVSLWLEGERGAVALAPREE